jgi:hypothetical protein
MVKILIATVTIPARIQGSLNPIWDEFLVASKYFKKILNSSNAG